MADTPAPPAEPTDEALIQRLQDGWISRENFDALRARLAAKDAALAECRAKTIEECATEVEKLSMLGGSRWSNPTNAAALIRALATKEAQRHE